MPLVRSIIFLFVVFPTLFFSNGSFARANAFSPCIEAPALPIPSTKVVTVSTTAELYRAISTQSKGTTILIKPGIYELSSSVLGITADNVTIRGLENNCNSVHLVGPGMDNPKLSFGFWISAQNTTIANLTISDIYFHTIQISPGAKAPKIYNVRMVNSGQQFVKSNPVKFENGVDNGIVAYSIMEYTDGPSLIDREGSGTGYTNGVDIHAGKGWRISNNQFRNFHTPDHADYLWNAAILAWNGARDTITENNVFINVDRAVAYGLREKDFDHRGGVIRNNMVVMKKGLYSEKRRKDADATIIIWDSPGTKVLHNTLLTNGNLPHSIELRFQSDSVEVSNNIVDADISHRDQKYFMNNNNVKDAKVQWFENPTTGNLRLKKNINQVTNQVIKHQLAGSDVDGEDRPFGRKVDIGADELN